MDGSDEAEKAWSRAQSITSKANSWRFLGMFPFYTSPPKASWELPGVEDLLVICHLWRGAHHSHGGLQALQRGPAQLQGLQQLAVCCHRLQGALDLLHLLLQGGQLSLGLPHHLGEVPLLAANDLLAVFEAAALLAQDLVHLFAHGLHVQLYHGHHPARSFLHCHRILREPHVVSNSGEDAPDVSGVPVQQSQPHPAKLELLHEDTGRVGRLHALLPALLGTDQSPLGLRLRTALHLLHDVLCSDQLCAVQHHLFISQLLQICGPYVRQRDALVVGGLPAPPQHLRDLCVQSRHGRGG
mmetsp:Transcript_79034/g.189852  ORF Transcript_79034/g.189852 Transcript_79034/m.189852 type:complete len:298 (+) Transcript_79034:96-989(+)